MLIAAAQGERIAAAGSPPHVPQVINASTVGPRTRKRTPRDYFTTWLRTSAMNNRVGNSRRSTSSPRELTG